MDDAPKPVDRAAHAWREAMALVGQHSTGGRVLRGAHSTTLFTTGVPAAHLNAVVSTATDPDVAEVERLVAAEDWTGKRWSIVVRRPPDDELLASARRYGLDATRGSRFQLIDLPGLAGPSPADPGVLVRRVDGTEAALYTELLGAGFGLPPEVLEPVTTPALLDAPAVTGYVAEVRGEPCGTAMTVVVGDCAVLLNVATLPAHRSRGVGRAVTGAALRHAADAGAGSACLHPTPEGTALYVSLGAVTAEHWTFLERR